MYLYRAYDHHGRLLYIGITTCWHERLKGHRRASRWYGEVQSWEVAEMTGGEFAARSAEKQAIKAEDPIYNVVHSPRWRNVGRGGGWVPTEPGRTAA